ncbi:hypothetical protein SISSUDRAFT_1040303 [Sistotremastrum suecicum HHB10207 ss-3]|uniref:F-box domain-containing protein n=1 Tax=Sistotremastrum suecicum HHB10207 ss-3 TaxID=1314776 RepID=A0A166I2K4_9AGAM|nr:hypothetical protein SISSUDRAFT_1040303 [Sistotremastrum suecicum HHB10207 ss-3]
MSNEIEIPTTKIKYGNPIEHLAFWQVLGHPGEFPFPDGVRHALVVDCGDMEALSSKDDEFLTKIRRFVQDQDSHDVDLIRIRGTHPRNLPNEATWKALDGLRPRHLELLAGLSEEADITPLDALETPWPLESLCIVDVCQDLVTKHLWSVSRLTLYYMCRTSLILPEDYIIKGPSALRHFTCIGNDAYPMLTQWRNTDMSCIIDNLESLRLESSPGMDFGRYTYPEFVQFLQNCTALKSLDLVLSQSLTVSPSEDPEKDERWRNLDQYLIDLPKYLPPSLEHLKIRSIADSAQYIGVWLDYARNPDWMPRLKSVSLRYDLPVRDPDQGEKPPLSPSRSEATELLESFYQELALRAPSVERI